jgi:hypothetical protein
LKIKMQKDDDGFWHQAESRAHDRQQRARDALSLCAAHPDKGHNEIALIAKSQYGWARMSFYRYLRGQTCVHDAQPAHQNGSKTSL